MGCINGATIGIILTLAAVIIGGIGVFSNAWWMDGRKTTYSLFTVVNCTEDVCALSSTGVESWILFGQVSGLSSFIVLLGSLLLQLLHRCCEKTPFLYAMLTLMGISCLMAILHTFVMVAMYHKLSNAYNKQLSMPQRHDFLYDTLPVGLIAISGALCVPACLSIIVYRIKQSYDYKTDPKNPNRVV